MWVLIASVPSHCQLDAFNSFTVSEPDPRDNITQLFAVTRV